MMRDLYSSLSRLGKEKSFIGKKMGALKGSLSKVETVVFEMTLKNAEFPTVLH